MQRRRFLVTSGALAAVPQIAAGPVRAGNRPSMGVVVKIGGIPWFEAMKTGIEEQGRAIGVEAFMVGPASTDPALQVAAIEALIARRVAVIGVVPNDEKALEPVLERAIGAGIKIVTHEGPGIRNKHWDFEMISAQGFAEAHAELLARRTGGKGRYAIYVGGAGVPLHQIWADSAVAYLKARYPGLQQIGERHGVAENAEDSRRKTLELIASTPDLTGILAFGSQGPIGAGQALSERQLIGRLHVVGPHSPGQALSLLKSGAIAGGFMWNPKEAGRVFVTLGKMLVDGTAIIAGTEIPGLGKVTPDAARRSIVSDRLIAITAETADGLAAMGL